MTGPAQVLLLHRDDDVVTCVQNVPAGVPIDLGERGTVMVRAEVPAGHKIAVVDIAVGAPVRKYGEAIGVATQPIRRGEHVHVHNLRSARARSER